MPRKKKTKALFELLDPDKAQSDKKLNVPGWFSKGAPAASAPPVAKEVPADGGAPALGAPSIKPPAPPKLRSGEPVVAIDDGRLRVSLGAVSGAAVALGALGLLLAGFAIGRASAPATVRATDNGDIPKPLLTPDVAGGVVPVPGGAAVSPLPPDNAARRKGLWYLVIQGGIDADKRHQAEDIKRFLHANEVNATIHRTSTSKWLVKDLNGFKGEGSNRPPSSVAAKYHVGEIERLGRKYLRTPKGEYAFRQGTPAWWVKETK